MNKLVLATIASLSGSAAFAVPVQFNTGAGATGNYYEVGLVATSFANAQAIANSSTYAGLTGHLVTFESAEEEAFVADLLIAAFGTIVGQSNQSVAWIGLSDAASEGNFQWTDGPEAGTAPTYTNWLGGEPNNVNGNEHFVHMTVNYAYGWNDVPGYFSLAYITEYSQPAPVPLPAGGLLLLTGLGALALRRRI